MNQIGKNRGTYSKGGIIDNKRTSNLILTDFREAKIGEITLEKAPN